MGRLARYTTLILVSATLATTLLGSWAAARLVDLPNDDEFNVFAWEVRNAPGKWIYLTGRAFRGELSAEEADERVGRFLVLSTELARSGSALERAALLDEREAIENDVEAVIEGRLTSLLEDAGLESSLPLFPGARLVWPPVDVEFDAPPRSLAVSPRDRIELVEQRPLRPGQALAEVEAIEAEAERGGELSALAVPIAGRATYPSIVAPHADYQALVATIAHEWVHHYLSFKPLGVRYLDSLELQTLNETVADLSGEELAALYVQRHPLPQDAAQPTEVAPEDGLELGLVLRALRLEVEALLTAGEVEQAEALMEERRLELAKQGIVFRKINQAFFAFRNVYAGDPASIDPIGAKVIALRDSTGSIGAFLHEAGTLTSEADLDRLLQGTSRLRSPRPRRREVLASRLASARRGSA